MVLTLNDISDVRAYENEREKFRAKIIALKKLRRIHLGEVLTFLFENRDTMRFQIQEMARAEKIYTDEKIQNELAVYNDLIPSRNILKSTLFVELVNEEQLREWLPKLVDIQNHLYLEFNTEKVKAYEPDEDRLTRDEEITTSVHYIFFEFSDEQREKFLTCDSEIKLISDHEQYQYETVLSGDSIAQLKADLIG
jgi:hypothetical protein